MVPFSSSSLPASDLKGHYYVSQTVANLFLFLKSQSSKAYRTHTVNVLAKLNTLLFKINVWGANTILLNALNLAHLAVPSSQLLSVLITQVVVKLEGQYNCCVWRVTGT